MPSGKKAGEILRFISSFSSLRDCSSLLLVVQCLKDVASYILSIFLVVMGGHDRISLDPVIPSGVATEVPWASVLCWWC